MYDAIFFINHALNAKQLSVYTQEERFQQTVDTINSIDKHCPNNQVFIFDSSPEMPDMSYFQELNDRGAIIFYTGNIPIIKQYSNQGQRSIAECYSFMTFLSWFKDQDYRSKRIYKLSGRYRLTDDFVLDDDGYENAFVFSEALNSWMPPQSQKLAEIDKLLRVRLWHMDYNLLDTFINELPIILNDCVKYNIDVEHSYYKHLKKYKLVELKKIGVCGNIAPSGEYIDE